MVHALARRQGLPAAVDRKIEFVKHLKGRAEVTVALMPRPRVELRRFPGFYPGNPFTTGLALARLAAASPGPFCPRPRNAAPRRFIKRYLMDHLWLAVSGIQGRPLLLPAFSASASRLGTRAGRGGEATGYYSRRCGRGHCLARRGRVRREIPDGEEGGTCGRRSADASRVKRPGEG